MSTAAIMLVKDEADIIEATLRHLATQVDEIIVSDNGSTDGTEVILGEIELSVPLLVSRDEEAGHYQGRKMTALAGEALRRGHTWAICHDADEVWYSPDGRPIKEFLQGLGPEVSSVRALIWNHFPTTSDPWREQNPLKRIVWRQPAHAPAQFGKVVVKLRHGLLITEGNHGAFTPGIGVEGGGLELRHFSWRDEEQYVRKIANGYWALKATDLPESTGLHWRMHGEPFKGDWEDRVRATFAEHYFYTGDPLAAGLELSPAPVRDS